MANANKSKSLCFFFTGDMYKIKGTDKPAQSPVLKGHLFLVLS